MEKRTKNRLLRALMFVAVIGAGMGQAHGAMSPFERWLYKYASNKALWYPDGDSSKQKIKLGNKFSSDGGDGILQKMRLDAKNFIAKNVSIFASDDADYDAKHGRATYWVIRNPINKVNATHLLDKVVVMAKSVGHNVKDKNLFDTHFTQQMREAITKATEVGSVQPASPQVVTPQAAAVASAQRPLPGLASPQVVTPRVFAESAAVEGSAPETAGAQARSASVGGSSNVVEMGSVAGFTQSTPPPHGAMSPFEQWLRKWEKIVGSLAINNNEQSYDKELGQEFSSKGGGLLQKMREDARTMNLFDDNFDPYWKLNHPLSDKEQATAILNSFAQATADKFPNIKARSSGATWDKGDIKKKSALGKFITDMSESIEAAGVQTPQAAAVASPQRPLPGLAALPVAAAGHNVQHTLLPVASQAAMMPREGLLTGSSSTASTDSVLEKRGAFARAEELRAQKLRAQERIGEQQRLAATAALPVLAAGHNVRHTQDSVLEERGALVRAQGLTEDQAFTQMAQVYNAAAKNIPLTAARYLPSLFAKTKAQTHMIRARIVYDGDERTPSRSVHQVFEQARSNFEAAYQRRLESLPARVRPELERALEAPTAYADYHIEQMNRQQYPAIEAAAPRERRAIEYGPVRRPTPRPAVLPVAPAQMNQPVAPAQMDQRTAMEMDTVERNGHQDVEKDEKVGIWTRFFTPWTAQPQQPAANVRGAVAPVASVPGSAESDSDSDSDNQFGSIKVAE